MRGQHEQQPLNHLSPRLALWGVVWGCLVVSSAAHGELKDEAKRGEVLYQKQCAKCHGARGEGTKENSTALRGELSVAELAQLIEETMPEDNPESCVGEQARLVARHMHESFYFQSTTFRAPVVTRLTAVQHRRAIVDTLAGFLGPTPKYDERGMKAEYFDDRRMNASKRKLTRVDPVIDFDWGDQSPLPGEISDESFCMRWQGSLVPAKSGEHEIVIETDNGVRLWLNDREAAVIDGWVKSGDRATHRVRTHLLAGRGYYLRLELLSFKEKQAAVRLLWKPPGGVLQVIPARCLSTASSRAAPLIATEFPPDDRSLGFERGASVSGQWNRAVTSAALEAADWSQKNLRELARWRRDDADSVRRDKARQFCGTLLQRAMQLDKQAAAKIAGRFFEAGEKDAPELSDAVKRCVILAFSSPRFAFRFSQRDGSGSSLARADALSNALWDSTPDTRLYTAAGGGKLTTRQQLTVEARRMLRDPRARAKLRLMLRHYFVMDEGEWADKDPKSFSGFDEGLRSSLESSLMITLERVIWEGSGKFDDMMLASEFAMDAAMRRFYQDELAAVADQPPWEELGAFEKSQGLRGNDFRLVRWRQHEGIITHPFVLAKLAYSEASSPVHRGVFLTRHVLGRRLKPPPEAVTPLPVDAHLDLTTRQRVELQTRPTACQTCHRVINPLGFSLEHYDAVGRYRKTEGKKSIDAQGHYVQRDGKRVPFRSAVELARFLAASREAHESFVEQLVEQTVKQPAVAFGESTLRELTDFFEENDLNIPALWVEIAVRTTLSQ